MAFVGGSCAVDDAENIGLNFDVCFCPLWFLSVFHCCINYMHMSSVIFTDTY